MDILPWTHPTNYLHLSLLHMFLPSIIFIIVLLHPPIPEACNAIFNLKSIEVGHIHTWYTSRSIEISSFLHKRQTKSALNWNRAQIASWESRAEIARGWAAAAEVVEGWNESSGAAPRSCVSPKLFDIYLVRNKGYFSLMTFPSFKSVST